MPQGAGRLRSEEDHWFATEKKFLPGRAQPSARAASHSLTSIAPSWSTISSSPRGRRSERRRAVPLSGSVRQEPGLRLGPRGPARQVGRPAGERPDRDALGGHSSSRPSTGGLNRYLGEDAIPIAVFKIQSGKDEPITHMALANLPMVPNVIPRTDGSGKSPRAATGGDPLHGNPHARPQDQRPLRPDRSPGRTERVSVLPRLRPGQGRARASSAPPGQSRRASRSSPSAARPTCR